MPFALLRRRTILVPTLAGWACGFAALAVLAAIWAFGAEPFLGKTQRVPADVLIVEGWIGPVGVQAAKAEFIQGGYKYIVATSGLTGDPWDSQRWSYALETEEQLLRLKIPRDQVILAKPREVERQRTFESAAAVARALQAKGIKPAGVNVFTRDVHARRSRLIFSRVLRETTIGVIGWIPPGSEVGMWWSATDRTNDVMKESSGYLFELLLNSGRFSNSPDLPADPKP